MFPTKRVYKHMSKSKNRHVLLKYFKKLIKHKSVKSYILISFIVFYIINPFDIIPDFAPVIGFLDDLTAILIGIETLRRNEGIKEFKKKFKFKVNQLKERLIQHNTNERWKHAII